MKKKAYMAPMEGVTGDVYRRAYHACFSPMDKYFTPFLAAKRNKRLSQKEEREISPKTNPGMTVIPQILANNAQDFIELALICKDYGHDEVNLNLGCPSGTVTAKGKGAGFLREPGKLEAFLDEIYTKLDMKISVKTRIGADYLEEWEGLFKLYEKFPMEELIIHPRLLVGQYQGSPHWEIYKEAESVLSMPLCYNGNLFSVRDCKRAAAEFPETKAFMYGRGLIGNPGLIGELRQRKPMDTAALRVFHDRLYEEYQTRLSGDRNVLFRMKELWSYMLPSFVGAESYGKKIKKSQKCAEYETLVNSLFQNCELAHQIKEEDG